MSGVDIAIIVTVAGLVSLVAGIVIRKKIKGGGCDCGCDCGHCSAGKCSECGGSGQHCDGSPDNGIKNK